MAIGRSSGARPGELPRPKVSPRPGAREAQRLKEILRAKAPRPPLFPTPMPAPPVLGDDDGENDE